MVQPFPLGQLSPAIAFNPKINSIRVQYNTGQSVLSIPGSQTNTITGIGGNFLTGNNTSFEGANTWVNSGTSAIAVSSVTAHTGNSCLAVTSVGTGTTSAASVSSANILTGGMRASFNDTVFVGIWTQAASIPRSCKVQINWVDNTGTTISQVNGNLFTNAVGSWTFIWTEFVAPANTFAARMLFNVSSPGAGEVHYIDDAVLYNMTQNPPGQVSIYQQFFPQAPFPAVIPNQLQYNSSFVALRQQYSTALPGVFVPGSTANVNISGQFADETATVNIPESSTPGINVAAQAGSIVESPQGVAASVNVSGPNGTITEIISGTTDSVVISGQTDNTIVETVFGPASSVSVVAIPGTPVITPNINIAGVTATVSVGSSGQGFKNSTNTTWWLVRMAPLAYQCSPFP